MSKERGSLSIHSENIFPIIKKWLYSDQDIFIRELISNACDAITKLKKLEVMGEYQLADDNIFRVDVLLNDKEKTLTFIDNGIGMTADEVKQYINQIAFSGAEAFLNQYKDKTNEDQIIGHFGLGFYSSFMVSKKVTIDTLSFKEGSQPVHWECDGGTEFELSVGDKLDRGTRITLHIDDEHLEFANAYKIKEIINKYCSFMPVEIYFTDVNAKKEPDVKVDEETDEISVETEVTEEKPLNNPHPLWTKHPNDCTDEDYKNFYREVFLDFKEPLFWIHLNMDYPFNLKGILYFPKIGTEFDPSEGRVKLYNNQVFVADNIKEVIPEFLLVLKGIIDCPDLPLNVSRSFLQNDGFVKKISDYITKKVADKLSGMYKTEKEAYENYWDDINPFIKYGYLRDDKFASKMQDYLIFKTLYGKYVTLKEYLEANQEKHKDKVFYVTDETQQSQYVHLFKQQEMDAVILTHSIDQPFVTTLEQKEKEVKFLRIDSDLSESLKDSDADETSLQEMTSTLSELFKKSLNKEKLEVKVEALKSEELASMILLSEETRRMQDMGRMYGMFGFNNDMLDSGETLVLNSKNKLVQYILANQEGEHTQTFCEQLYDLASLSHKQLTPEAMTRFINRSNEILLQLAR